MTVEIIANRYELQEMLGEGGMGEVYRAFDRLTRKTVALKRVRVAASQNPSTETQQFRLGLTNEFRNLATLRHPNIITVLDYGFDTQNNPFFTMFLVEYARDFQVSMQGKNFYEQAPYLVQVLQALAYLHRRHIVHRDLKPDNILITEDGDVKVLDFGLSTIHSRSQQNDENTAGTLAYMAPELFMGEAATPASDLYAFGVILYELIAGKHPFETANIAALINSILTKTVDVVSLGLSPAMTDILESLLAKEPQNRYQSAEEVLRDLAEAADLPQIVETAAIRESYLEAAKFVGRQKEIDQLAEALKQAKVGKGAVCLIGGEAGVGKSRLLDELRTHALVAGASVLRGQAVREGGTAYQVWHDVLPSKLLHIDITDEEAAILVPHIPNLKHLLRRECTIPTLQDLDPAENQRRFWRTVLDINKRIQQPVVIMLEDLHWESSESLGLLNYLEAHVHEMPLLIIGTYRSDERPDIPDIVSGTHRIMLERLTDQETSELAAAMLGEVGTEQRLLNLLKREAEGNVFFLVEAVRTLAADAGQLAEIANSPLPDKILSGGIDEIIRRRLQQIPKEDYELLVFAAIAGRQLDLNLLSHLDPAHNLNQWLNTGLAAAVLEIRDQEWRFAHDKLRDSILFNLSELEHPEKHRRVARMTEELYGDDPERAANLAHLWYQAGDCEKVLHYAVQAGHQQLEHGVNDAAADFFHQALHCLLRLPPSVERDLYEMRVQFLLSVALTAVKGYAAPEVEQALLRAKELCEDIGDWNQLFRILFGLASVYSSRARLEEAYTYAETLAEIAQETQSAEHILISHSVQGWILFRMGDIPNARQHLDATIKLYGIEPDRLGDVEKYRSLGLIYGQDPGLTSLCYGALITTLMGEISLGKAYTARALELADKLDYPAAKIFAEFYVGAMLKQFVRDWKTQLDYSNRVLELDAEYGFPFFRAMAKMVRGQTRTHFDEGEAGLEELEEGLELWVALGAGRDDINWMQMRLEAYITSGMIEEGFALVSQADQILETTSERFGEIDIQIAKGRLLLLSGDEASAETALREAIEQARSKQARLFELRAIIMLSHTLQPQGRHQEAIELLSDVLMWFEDSEDVPVIKEAQSILEELHQFEDLT